MGLLRFLLAAAVIAAHSTSFGFPLVPGATAVQAFFVISGFYMALILDRKYERKADGLRLFYTNRLLRIFPLYYVVLIVSLLFCIASTLTLGKPVNRFEYWMEAAHLGLWPALSFLALGQVVLIGLDFTEFFGFTPGTGFAWGQGTIPMRSFDFLPQAWSIGVELVFYAAAPFLVHRSARFLGALVAAWAAFVLMIPTAFPNDLAWAVVNYFCLFQTGFFLLGILAYRIYRSGAGSSPSFRFLRWGLLSALAGWAVIAGMSESRFVQYVFSGLVFASLPFLFDLTKKSRIDRWIAELSYPMYLTHVLVRWGLFACQGVHDKAAGEVRGLPLLGATVAVSILLVAVIDLPMERLRQRRVQTAAQAA